MNIFFLSRIPLVAAKLHSDKHVVKMCLESAQILATVHHIHGNGENVKYKSTHAKHPCVLWAAASRANYIYVRELGIHLCRQYTSRYGKYHACHELFRNELLNPPPALKFSKPTDPAQAMPDECKDADPVKAYRRYYRHKLENTNFMRWDKLQQGYIPQEILV